MKKEFGFYPATLRIDAGPISVRTLPELDSIVDSVLGCGQVEDGWIHAPPERSRRLGSRQIETRPFSARVFGLSKTHTIEHTAATGSDHLEFLGWCLSFFLGTRLTTTDAGFLDATPVKPGQLVDFVLRRRCLEQATELADGFWLANRSEPQNARRYQAAVHALFLGQYRQALQFERFIYLYAALDACFKIAESLRRPARRFSHADRIGWMCSEYGIDAPAWAKPVGTSGSETEVSVLRNHALHEALYVGEPLGFALHGTAAGENVPLEMIALVCRLLVAFVGAQDSSYLKSPVNTRQRHGLYLG